jgi:hypothetical protein
MSFSVTYEDETDCLYVTIDGDLDLTLFKEMSARVGVCLKERGCTRILNDLRNALPTDSAGEIYFMPKQALDAGIARSIRRALLVSGDFSEYSFLETVFINQGNIVKLFDDIEEAKNWLFGGGKDNF